MVMQKMKCFVAIFLSLLILISSFSVMAAELGTTTGGIDFDAANQTHKRLLYGSMFYVDWSTGTGLTNHDSDLPGQDCSGSAPNGANPDMVFEMKVTFTSLDGVADPATCWNEIKFRFRSTRVEGDEQPCEFYSVFRSAYGDAAVVNVQVPLSEFSTGKINWSDVKDIIIQVPLKSAYHLGDTGDSTAISMKIEECRIVDYAGLASRIALKTLVNSTRYYRYDVNDNAATYETALIRANALLSGYHSDAEYASMVEELKAAIAALTNLQDVAENAMTLVPDKEVYDEYNGDEFTVVLSPAEKADLSLHSLDNLYVWMEGFFAEPDPNTELEMLVPFNKSTITLNDGSNPVTFSIDQDDMITMEDEHYRFRMPLPKDVIFDWLNFQSATLKLDWMNSLDFTVVAAGIGDSTLVAEEIADAEKYLSEAPQLIINNQGLVDDYNAALLDLKKAVENPVWASAAEVADAKTDLLSVRHAWRESSLGDVDDNLQITASDALITLQAATKKIVLQDDFIADVDGEKGVTAMDALTILQYSTKKIDGFTATERSIFLASDVINAEDVNGKYAAALDALSPDTDSIGLTKDKGYLKYTLDFADGGAKRFMGVLSAAEESVGQNIEIRLDHLRGECVGKLTLASTGGENRFDEQYATLTKDITGVHDIYLVGPDGVHLDCFVFSSYTGEETKEEAAERLAWWNDARFGMFIHWGAYANFPFEPDYADYGKNPLEYSEWVMDKLQIPPKVYEELTMPTFAPTQWDAERVVQLAKDAGQKYIVFTSKHHEGFSMYDTQVEGFRNFGLMTYGAYKGEDPMMQLAKASKEAGIPFGCYYTIMDWKHDTQSSYGHAIGDKARYVADMKAQLRELIQVYGVDILWFDGEWIGWWTKEDGQDLYEYLRTLKPDLVINNRIGKRHDDDGDFGTPEQEIPNTGMDIHWESCITMNNSWGYRETDTNWKSPIWIVQSVVDTASKGGNILLNIGPDAEGRVPADCTEIMETAGKWFTKYGDSIYGTTASPFEETLSFGKATKKEGALYLHVLNRPSNGKISIPALKNELNSVHVMGDTNELPIEKGEERWIITLPTDKVVEYDTVIVLEVEGIPREKDVYVLSENYALGATASDSNHYDNLADYDGSKAIDGAGHTRWATADDVTECWLEVDFGKEVTFNTTETSEFTDTGGQRVTSYNIEYWDGTEWKIAHTSNTIGNKKTDRFADVTAQKVRLHILTIDVASQGGPSIWEFGVYKATLAE